MFCRATSCGLLHCRREPPMVPQQAPNIGCWVGLHHQKPCGVRIPLRSPLSVWDRISIASQHLAGNTSWEDCNTITDSHYESLWYIWYSGSSLCVCVWVSIVYWHVSHLYLHCIVHIVHSICKWHLLYIAQHHTTSESGTIKVASKALVRCFTAKKGPQWRPCLNMKHSNMCRVYLYYLVGGFNPSHKYWSIGIINGKIKNVPNHQPGIYRP